MGSKRSRVGRALIVSPDGKVRCGQKASIGFEANHSCLSSCHSLLHGSDNIRRANFRPDDLERASSVYPELEVTGVTRTWAPKTSL